MISNQTSDKDKCKHCGCKFTGENTVPALCSDCFELLQDNTQKLSEYPLILDLISTCCSSPIVSDQKTIFKNFIITYKKCSKCESIISINIHII